MPRTLTFLNITETKKYNVLHQMRPNNADGTAFCTSCGTPMPKLQNANAGNAQNTAQAQNAQSFANQQSANQNTAYNAPNNGANLNFNAPPSPAPKKSHNGVLIAILIILLVLALGACAVLAYFYINDGDSKTTGKTSESTEEIVKDETDDLETDEDEDELEDEATDDDDDKKDNKKDNKDEKDDESVTSSSNTANARNAVKILNSSIASLRESGSWSEYCIMEYTASTDSESILYQSEIVSNVTSFDPDDPSKAKINGRGGVLMDGSDLIQEWTYTYQNGKATYNFTEPSVTSSTIEIDPELFNTDSLKAGMISSVKIYDGTMNFVISSKSAQDMLESMEDSYAMSSGADSISYSDIKVTFNYDKDTMFPEFYMMEFTAEISINGMDITADYEVAYSFNK